MSHISKDNLVGEMQLLQLSVADLADFCNASLQKLRLPEKKKFIKSLIMH